MKSKKHEFKDQFFLHNPQLIKQIVDLGNLTKNDTVLEIGAGHGNITTEIAQKAGSVIAFEIDKQFKIYLTKLPQNVDVHYGDALDFLKFHKKHFTKIIANPPYSMLEPLLHYLTLIKYDKVILVAPLKMVNKIKNGIFGSYFDPQIKIFVDKTQFTPSPKTNSVILDLLKLPDPLITKNLKVFLCRYIYHHGHQKLKNSLMEGLIRFSKLADQKDLTKNEAREIIKTKDIDMNFLNTTPTGNIIYAILSEKFENL